LMEAMASLITADMPSEADSAQQKAFVTYSYPHHSTEDSISHDRTVTLLEARSVISSSGTTGLRTWEAALLLGSYLASETGRASIQGKRLFELGAGTGMLSILCAKHLGVAGVVATDGDEAVVDAIKTNLFLNGLDTTDTSECQVRTAALKWGYRVDATTFSEDYGMEVPDVVVGADVVSYRHYKDVVVEMWVNSVADLRQVRHSTFSLNAGRIFRAEPSASSFRICDDSQRGDVRDLFERV
jgi:predicted nicotinamide N-methyase